VTKPEDFKKSNGCRHQIEAVLGGNRETTDGPPTTPTTSATQAQHRRALPWAIAVVAGRYEPRAWI
jgi:hypothetical protein